jgi:hypothetical protein
MIHDQHLFDSRNEGILGLSRSSLNTVTRDWKLAKRVAYLSGRKKDFYFLRHASIACRAKLEWKGAGPQSRQGIEHKAREA